MAQPRPSEQIDLPWSARGDRETASLPPGSGWKPEEAGPEARGQGRSSVLFHGESPGEAGRTATPERASGAAPLPVSIAAAGETSAEIGAASEPWPTAGGGAGVRDPWRAPPPAAPAPIDLAALERTACDLWLVGRPAANERLALLAGERLVAASGGALAGVALGTSLGVHTREGRTLAWDELPPQTQDTVYTALRLALVAGCDARARLPVVVTDDPDGGDVPRLVAAQLGISGQVLFLTSDPTRAEAGSPVHRLGA